MKRIDNKDENKDVELKIPFLIPIIISIVVGVVGFKIYESRVQAKNVVEQAEVDEKQQEVVQEPIEPESEEEKTITYTAENGETYEIIATLNIPSLNIKYPVLSSTSDALLKVSLNKYWGPNPNEVGNLVILGHNYENTKFFSKLPNIKIGDVVQITDIDGQTLEYTVYETDVIDPDDNACTSQLTNGKTEITLITCVNKGIQRFYAKARAN